MFWQTLDLILIWLVGLISERQNKVAFYLFEENRVLKESLDKALNGRRLRLNDQQRIRLAVKAKQIPRKTLDHIACIFSPETILRWHRQLVAQKYTPKPTKKGRPTIEPETVRLIIKIAKENPTWGYTRIQGTLVNLHIKVHRSTIRRVLKNHGIEPAPERTKTMSWSRFIKTQFTHIAATDFFTLEIWTKTGLTRFHVLFAIHLVNRTVDIAGIVREPNGAWMKQKAREWTDPFDGFLKDKKYLIHDRGTVFTEAFKTIIESEGLQAVKLPARSPNLNAYAERFVRSIKMECLNRILIFGERHLEKVVKEYAAHYHEERNHQGLKNKLIQPSQLPDQGKIKTKQRIGGLLNYYYRDNAA